jgi:hypothetical protein
MRGGMGHFIGADEEERQTLFGEACKKIESKISESEKTLNANDLIREVASEKQFNRDMVQQALWSLVESGRVQIDAKFEVSLVEAPNIA